MLSGFFQRVVLFISSVYAMGASFVCFGQGFPVYSELCNVNRLIVNNDGSFVVAGSFVESTFGSFLPGNGGSIAKFSIDGTLLWHADVRTPPSSNIYMYLSDATKAGDSGYVICGDSTYITGLITRPNYLYLIKYDESGNRQWKKDYPSNDANCYGSLNTIRQNVAGSGYYCSGYSLFYKMNAAGDSLFAANNPGVSGRFGLLNNGGIAFADFATPERFRLTDSSFSVVASDNCTLNYGLRNFDIFQTSDSSWLLAGTLRYSNARGNIFLNKMNKDGRFIWTKLYAYNDLIGGVGVTEHNSQYFITGTAKRCLNTDTPLHCYGVSDAVILATDTAGVQTSLLTISGDSVVADSLISYYGFQSEFLGDTMYTLGTRQYLRNSQITTLERPYRSGFIVWKHVMSDFVNTEKIQDVKANGFMVYPNPASGNFTVKLPEGVTEPASAIVYDVQGRVCFRRQGITSAELLVSTEGWLSGLYFVVVNTQGYIFRQKLAISGH